MQPGVHEPSGEAGSPLPPLGSPRIEVTGVRAQRIEGWGFTVVGQGREEPIVRGGGLSRAQLNALRRLVFRKAGVDLVRVFGPNLAGKVARVRRWTGSHPRLRFMRQARRYGVRFMFTGGGAPASMRKGRSTNGALLPGRERAYARFLARSFAVAERSGARFRWAAVGNEPDIFGARWVGMTPEQTAAVYRYLERDLRRRGLKPRLVLGDNEGWRKTYEYAVAEAEQPRVRKRASVVASHDYSDLDPASMGLVADFARDSGLSLWMTEWTSGCTEDPRAPDTQLDLALRWAARITGDLGAGVQAWFMLQAVSPSFHGAGCGFVLREYGDPSRPYTVNKRYAMLRQFTSVGSRGAYRYEVDSETGDIPALAFRHDGTTGLVLTNPTAVDQTVRLTLSDRPGRLRLRRTSATEDFALVDDSSYGGGEITRVLPARSISTFRLDQ